MDARLHPGLIFGLTLGLLLLASCAGVPPTPRAAPSPPRPPVTPPSLVILQSDESPAYAEVAQAIAARWKGRVTLYPLHPHPAMNEETRARVQSSATQLVVAVGLPAARQARRLSGKKVIFCQVFNYEQAGLVTPWMKGVSALPPFGEQFRAWKALSPDLAAVSVITGKGLQGMMREAVAAANSNGIALRHIEVDSDLELRYAFERTSPEIRALWLIPDNRVLSRDVLRDVLALSQKRKAQVLVFNEQLLDLGGVLSVDTSAGDIAEQVLARLTQAVGASRGVPGPDVMPLTRLDVRYNATMIRKLGLRSTSQSPAPRRDVS